MASFSRTCVGAVALLALVFACLLDSTSAIVYNYTSFFNPTVGCSLTVGPDGSIYVGLCSQQTIIKLSSAYAAQTAYNTQVQQTLKPYTNNSASILQLDQLGISSAGTLWFVDIYNQRVLGVDSTVGQTVSQINLLSVGGALAIGVSIYTANVWVATPGASTGTATISQYDPNGNLLTTISSTNDPTNLPSTYFIMGLEPDPTNTIVYVGGCNLVTPQSIIYEPGMGFEYETAPGNFYPCDVRAVSIANKAVQLPILTVSAATRAYLRTNTSFFQQLSVRSGGTNNNQFGAGTVWADDTYNGVVFAFNNGTGAQIANITGIAASPAFTPANNFVALGQSGLSVIQYNPGATPNTIYSISNVTFGNPGFVAVGNGGSPVYVSSLSGGPVAVMDTSANIQTYIGSGTLTYPEGMAVDGSGNLFVIDGGTNIGYKYSSSGNQLLTFSAPGSGVGAGVCVDPNNGNIYVPADNITTGAASGSGFVLVFNSAGTLINTIGQAISYPWTCVVLSNGMVVVDSANEPGAIYFLNPTTGNYTFFQDPALGASFETLGMTVSNDGRIFVAALNLGIYIFSQSGQYIDVISSPAEDIYCYSMAYTTASGGLLYVADAFNQRVVTFKVGTSGPGSSSSSDSTRTVSGAATTALFTIAALIFTLFISA